MDELTSCPWDIPVNRMGTARATPEQMHRKHSSSPGRSAGETNGVTRQSHLANT